MLPIIHQLLNIVFPPRPSERIIGKETSASCKILYHPHYYQDTLALLKFDDAKVRALITENKFHHNHRAATLLATLLEIWLHEQKDHILILPIPLSRTREKKRGYNQVVEVLRKLPNSDNYSIESAVVEKIIDTPAQTTLNRAARLKNVAGAFSCTQPEKLKALAIDTVVLLDDVVTTGSTVKAARAALAPHLPPGTKLISVALAH